MRDKGVAMIRAGSAGLVCAINLDRAGLDVMVFERPRRLDHSSFAC